MQYRYLLIISLILNINAAENLKKRTKSIEDYPISDISLPNKKKTYLSNKVLVKSWNIMDFEMQLCEYLNSNDMPNYKFILLEIIYNIRYDKSQFYLTDVLYKHFDINGINHILHIDFVNILYAFHGIFDENFINSLNYKLNQNIDIEHTKKLDIFIINFLNKYLINNLDQIENIAPINIICYLLQYFTSTKTIYNNEYTQINRLIFNIFNSNNHIFIFNMFEFSYDKPLFEIWKNLFEQLQEDNLKDLLIKAISHSKSTKNIFLLNQYLEFFPETLIIDINKIQEQQNKNVLSIALTIGMPPNIIKILINSGASLTQNFYNTEGEDLGSALHKLSHRIDCYKCLYLKDYIKIFIDNGLDPHTENRYCQIPIFIAASLGDLEIVKELIKYTNINYINLDNENIFHALFCPNEDRFMWEFCDNDPWIKSRVDVFKYLIKTIDPETAEFLLLSENIEGALPMEGEQDHLLGEIISYLFEHNNNLLIKILEKIETKNRTLNFKYPIYLANFDKFILNNINTENHKEILKTFDIIKPKTIDEVGSFESWMKLRHNFDIESIIAEDINYISKLLKNKINRFINYIKNNDLNNNLDINRPINSPQELLNFFIESKNLIKSYLLNYKLNIIDLVQGPCYYDLKHNNEETREPYFDETEILDQLYECKSKYAFYNLNMLFLSLFFTYNEILEILKELLEIQKNRYQPDGDILAVLYLASKEFDIFDLTDIYENNILYYSLSSSSLWTSIILINSFEPMIDHKNINNDLAISVMAKDPKLLKSMINIAFNNQQSLSN